MKKVIVILMALFFYIGIYGCTHLFAAQSNPVVSMGTPIVKMAGKKTAGVVIEGAGFKPGQEIHILFVSKDGLKSDIGYALKPTPKPDKTGSWSTTWKAGRFIAKKLVDPKGGSYKIIVTDKDYIPISETTVLFQAQ